MGRAAGVGARPGRRRGAGSNLAAGVLLCGLVVLASCGSDQPPNATVDSVGTTNAPSESSEVAVASSTTSSERDGRSSAATRSVDVAGEKRTYQLFVSDALPAGEAEPLIISLHGLSATGRQQMDYTQLNEFAASVKAIVAYPDARSDPKTLAPPSWVMTGTSERDFLRALVSDAATVHQIDSKKIYLTGISQGADVASLITCQDAGFYAGLASVAIINHHVSDCGDAPPIPVLSFVSSDDPIYSIDNGLILAVPDPDPPRSLAEESSGWAQRNLCKGEPVEDVLTPELTARTYGCDGAPFVVYVHHSGHVWPSEAKQGIDGNELIWKFLTAGD